MTNQKKISCARYVGQLLKEKNVWEKRRESGFNRVDGCTCAEGGCVVVHGGGYRISVMIAIGVCQSECSWLASVGQPHSGSDHRGVCTIVVLS